MSARGTLFGVGVGPGDPELMSLKAARILKSAPVIAYFAKKGSVGNARRIVDGELNPDAELVRLDYPFTTELPETDPCYRDALVAFYDTSAATLAAKLDAGQDVAVICAGDPFFYGSYAHLHERLAGTHRCEVIPGITAMSGCWTSASIAHDLRRRDACRALRHHELRCALRAARGLRGSGDHEGRAQPRQDQAGAHPRR